ncbi:MAG TPA: isoprenylcysteine carboxylmethyltransferase family protein [Gemmatimonadales bacterium]|nr:isoprenylcysteine carboxylmethyltransferase family protein [Gemmatimonadales bacterium]
MLILLRALTYATLFVAFFLVVVPQRILRVSGYVWGGSPVWFELAGIGLVILGFALVGWCLVTFAFVGKGTAAPFDPPRRLVVAGPYRFVRNPIYIGAILTMLGAALYLWSGWLVLYALVVLIVTHLLVILYEEPHLRRVFGRPYEEYLQRVHRWIPTWRS